MSGTATLLKRVNTLIASTISAQQKCEFVKCKNEKDLKDKISKFSIHSHVIALIY